MEAPASCNVEDFIHICLEPFNIELRRKNQNFELIEEPKLWELCIAKKNGKPKEDLPSIFYFLYYIFNNFFYFLFFYFY